ncbi:MAG: lysostaphin resistance A-like protein [Brachybacterium tyrofermentans]
MTSHHPLPQPPLHAESAPTTALSSPSLSVSPSPSPTGPYHRAARAIPHRSYWWRPLVAVAVAGFVWIVMNLQVMTPLMILGEIWPAAATSPSLMDPLNPVDQFLGLGMLALLVPAVLVGSLAGYGRAGIALSVLGRFRWALMGRAALIVVPVYLLINTVLNLVLEREAIVVPEFGPGVILAWLVVLVLAPLQCAGEEFAFRALPMQVFGTWLRWPLIGILVPVPLFVLGHGYNWVGQIDIALFAIVMGLLAWKTGGLEIPILLHTANNWTLFAISPLIPGFTEQGEVGFLGLALALAPMLGLSAGIWWWYSRRAGLGLWEPQRGRVQTLSSVSSSDGPSAPVEAPSSSAASTSRPLSV